MRSRPILRRIAPILVFSGVLLAAGAVTAWYARRSLRETFGDLQRCVSLLSAAEHLSGSTNQVQVRLSQFSLSGNRADLDSVLSLSTQFEQWIGEAERHASLEKEAVLLTSIRGGCEAFRRQLSLITGGESEAPPTVRTLMEKQVVLEVIPPVSRLLDHARQLLESTSTNHLDATARMETATLVLGICGAGAGLLAGYAAARMMRRSIVELSIPLRDAAGKLNEVVGPVHLSTDGDLRHLEDSFRKLVDHIGEAVEKLHRSQAETLRADQMATVGQLAAGIAHEILNPLTAIKIIVQGAIERGGEASLGGRDLEVIHEQILRLEKSIRNFLDFARPSKLEPRGFDARAALEETLALVSKKAERQGVRFSRHLPDPPVMIEGDSSQIRQVMLNLILNALDALPAGGEITVDMEVSPKCPPAENTAPSSVGCEHGWLTLRIADSGHGLPVELGERIFEPFVSSKETGSGLGLSISKRIVESHGGDIAAANLPAGGAQFIVRLPSKAVPAVKGSRKK